MVTLAQVLSRVESSDNPYALRFEPATYQNVGQGRFDRCVKEAGARNLCSTETAKIIACTSWGLYQIMGFNLYAKQGAPPIGRFLSDRVAQKAALAGMLSTWSMTPDDDASWIAARDGRVDAFAKMYNGTGNFAAYADKLVSAYKALSS